MFLPKVGDRVYENYYRERGGVCLELIQGPRGGQYAKIHWDDGMVVSRVNVRNLRATAKPVPPSEGHPEHCICDLCSTPAKEDVLEAAIRLADTTDVASLHVRFTWLQNRVEVMRGED